MHEIEPFYSWRELYLACEDEKSPFFGYQNSEVFYEHVIYDRYIHPQWDYFGSQTLYTKLLYANYNKAFCIFEMFGEWNDILYNDVMFFYRNVVEPMLDEEIRYFILLGENVLNFHSGDTDYYEEWFDNIEKGWIIGINFRDHVRSEFSSSFIDQYIAFGGKFDEMPWRNFFPDQLFDHIDTVIVKRLQM